MIKSFRHKELEGFFRTGSKAGIQPAHASKLRRILVVLDQARGPHQMNLPGFKLHPLGGDLEGFWSVGVNGNWRVVFRFDGEDAELVDYLDYHQECLMSRMFNPPHPGEILREEVIKPLDVSVTEAARRLGVSRVALSRILNEKAGISAEMAVRLGKALDSDAELWLRMQVTYDLWQAERRLRAAKVEPLKAA